MKYLSWNVPGLRDDRRRGTVGRYLREWGADIICLQETMTCQTDQQFWMVLGWGTPGAATSINASGRSGGLLLAWKEDLFEVIATWQGRHIAAARLASRADGYQMVAASAYGPTAVQKREELREDLSQLCTIFSRIPLIIGGDFDVTLALEDRPNGLEGATPDQRSSGTY